MRKEYIFFSLGVMIALLGFFFIEVLEYYSIIPIIAGGLVARFFIGDIK